MVRGAVVVLLLVMGAGAAFADPPFHDQVTAFRQARGLSLPTADPALVRSSGARAQALADTGVLSHVDEEGRGPGLQLTAEGFPPGEFGEVLGAGADPQEVWAAWLASPTHRAVLEAPGWTAWGAGSASVGQTTVWVIRFWKL
jgi:uncharacterized protein YkwD